MKLNHILIILILSFNFCQSEKKVFVDEMAYTINRTDRIHSKRNISYFIDPNFGSDENIGTEKSKPWRTFKRINRLVLSDGNKIEILSAGNFYESLILIGNGKINNPIEIKFAPGRYNFYPENTFKEKFHISNTNDAPDSLKSIAFYFLDSKNINVFADDADVVFRGKVINVCIINCENLNIDGFSFDYNRPTVSEFIVEDVSDNYADVKIHQDSKYKIIENKLFWEGEGWQHKAHPLWQIYNTKSNKIYRYNIPVEKLRFEKIDNNKVRIYFDQNPGFGNGLIYQNRDTFRDYVAVFINLSKNISWKNTNIYFMHGLGFVSQLSENIFFDSLVVSPRNASGRTSSAWADILHFSGCKGKIIISNSYLSATHDDPINVHGTHLKIIEILSNQKIIVRFMHPQTYGFNAYQKGDSIEFIRAQNLLPYGKNIISSAELLNDKEIEITFEQNIPKNIRTFDVIENITWVPEFKLTNSIITLTPTRGILITTRGNVIIENNEFIKTHMSSVLVADDANSWFESGYVRNVKIYNNRFIECGEPVIDIHPEVIEMVEDSSVHKNIKIINNYFLLENNLVLSAKSTDDILFEKNSIISNQSSLVQNHFKFENCSDIKFLNNYFNDQQVFINMTK